MVALAFFGVESARPTSGTVAHSAATAARIGRDERGFRDMAEDLECDGGAGRIVRDSVVDAAEALLGFPGRCVRRGGLACCPPPGGPGTPSSTPGRAVGRLR